MKEIYIVMKYVKIFPRYPKLKIVQAINANTFLTIIVPNHLWNMTEN